MDKMGHGTWYRLQKATNLELPKQPDRIEEEENLMSHHSSELIRVNNAEADAPNEYIDDGQQNRVNKIRKLQHLYEKDLDVKASQPFQDPDEFLTQDEYDPHEPFSEFKFRSFRKDRQVKQDYALIDVDDPEDNYLLTASTLYPDSTLSRDAIELVGIEEQQLLDHEKELE
jgi:hypothetical protein